MIKLSVKTSGVTVLAMDQKVLRQSLRALGNEVARGARAEIGRGGNFPASRTGTLKRSIKVFIFRSGEGVAIRARAFYAGMLEFGAKGPGRRVLPARPFMSAALAARAASINARLTEAIQKGIKVMKVKR